MQAEFINTKVELLIIGHFCNKIDDFSRVGGDEGIIVSLALCSVCCWIAVMTCRDDYDDNCQFISLSIWRGRVCALNLFSVVFLLSRWEGYEPFNGKAVQFMVQRLQLRISNLVIPPSWIPVHLAVECVGVLKHLHYTNTFKWIFITWRCWWRRNGKDHRYRWIHMFARMSEWIQWIC